MIRTALAALALVSSWPLVGNGQSFSPRPFNVGFYQLADDADFDYEVRFNTDASFAGVFTTARWIGPGGVDFGTSPVLTVNRDSFAQLGAAVFGDWTLEFTPTFTAQPVLGSGPRTLTFNVAPFTLDGLHTSRAIVTSPTPDSVFQLSPSGAFIDFTWIYEDGSAPSGRTASLQRMNLVGDAGFVSGLPQLYRAFTTFADGKTSGTAFFRAGSFRSNQTTVTGDADFLKVFLPSTQWRNLSAEAVYTFVAVPEPSGACLATAGVVGLVRRRRGTGSRQRRASCGAAATSRGVTTLSGRC